MLRLNLISDVTDPLADPLLPPPPPPPLNQQTKQEMSVKCSPQLRDAFALEIMTDWIEKIKTDCC